jgi:hypothetical protein
MRVIDESFITQFFLEASERGILRTAEHVQKRAQTLVPVRKIFESEKRGRGTTIETMTIPGKQTRSGQPETVGVRAAIGGGSPWKFRTGRAVGNPYADLSSRTLGQGLLNENVSPVTKSRIRGRVNSFSPVIQSPAGMIGGSNLRAWSNVGGGSLYAGTIRTRGVAFKLSDLLTTRGRYEVKKARAISHGHVGGRLHDSIHVEGPQRNGMQVYAFVSASASDPGSDHNYARDQEFGSRHNVKHPFLRPALRESNRLLRSNVMAEIRTGKKPKSSSQGSVTPVALSVRIDLSGLVDAIKETESLIGRIGAEG